MAIDFKAMMAAKKQVAPTPAPITAPVVEAKTVAEPVKAEPPASAAPKPMSFAERMALKNAAPTAVVPPTSPTATAISPIQNTSTTGPSPNLSAPVLSASSGASQPANIPAKEDTGTQLVEVPDTDVILRTGAVDPSFGADAKRLEETTETPETKQAYADIKAKIELLEGLEDTSLEGAMKELKKALLANPNAVALMLDPDFGKMVIALRRITKEAQVEAVKEKTSGTRKAKNVILDAEAMGKAFEEL